MLTRSQRLLVVVTALAVAATRLLALAKSPWDWDEILFCLAVADYDAAAHRPHPPGFPLFVALANVARVLMPSDFRALQLVTMLSAMLLFPLLFFLCRELRFSFPAAYSGALLAVFLPNVWLYGGTAFSDIPSLALTVAACAFLLRGGRDRLSLLLGALLLGLAAAIRPQALLIGAAPALLAVWRRRSRWREVAEAIALGISVIAIAYCGAILASSSYEDYAATAAKLREYLRTVDSFLSPTRPPLKVLFEFFFVRSIPGDIYARCILYASIAGAVIAAIRRDGNVAMLILMFLPFQIFAWLMLDYHSVTRYGITYAPMYAILAAAAAVGALAWIPGIGRFAGALIVIVFTAGLARWTMPALTEVRRNPSPPVLAMQWLNEQVPVSQKVFVHGSVMPYASYYIGGRDNTLVQGPEDFGAAPPEAGVVVAELPLPVMSAKRFVRGRGRLFEIVRQRYFDVTVIPAQAWAVFGEGWHFEEWEGDDVWRWMGARSEVRLPPADGPMMRLSLRLEPVLEKGPPNVEVRLNGEVVETVELTAPVERSWVVPARSDGWNELVLVSDRFVNPARDGFGADTRDLSLRLLGYDWVPAAR